MEIQAKGVRGELPVLFNWSDFHEGIYEWICLRRGWPGGYASLIEMPFETAEVFDYMLRTETAAKEDDSGAALEAAILAQEQQMRRLYEMR